jgi:hypothetical protein
MIVEIDYFPDNWIELVKKAIVEDKRWEIISIKDKPNSQFKKLILDVPDLFSLIFLGMYMGNFEMKDCIDETMPKVQESIDNLIKKIEEPNPN